MKKSMYNFFRDEDGAVTVDWVVLTAAVVALGIGTISLIQTSTDTLATDISASIEGGATSGNVSNYGGGAGAGGGENSEF